jgi:nitrite reductase (NO-forming)
MTLTDARAHLPLRSFPLPRPCPRRFGNGGPNLVSSFHVIGAVFDRLYRDGDLTSPPARGVQMALTAPGSASVVEIDTTHYPVGSYTLVRVAGWCAPRGGSCADTDEHASSRFAGPAAAPPL